MRPPTAWSPAKKMTPPKAVARNVGFMKRVPMMRPATAEEAVDVATASIPPLALLARILGYPMR